MARRVPTHFTIAVGWGPSVKNDAEEKFAIHDFIGVAPRGVSYYSGQETKLNMELLRPINDRLRRNWPKLKGEVGVGEDINEFSHLNHQWASHGKHSGLGQLEYFTLALDLFDQIPTDYGFEVDTDYTPTAIRETTRGYVWRYFSGSDGQAKAA
ncbi:hypothetical protein OROMI_014431 [Orobanche minor]